ncbi:MAG: hypothetical protein J0H49_21255 [Acidobacteria bacterium]|nr:hypothetical protein [Acidobacteriota bacterium]
MKGLFCVFLALLPVQAQSLTWRLPETLITYLGLTNSQAQQISKNNSSYTELVAQKNARIWQVQEEISEETSKDPIDPSALGVRYMEIELICRDISKAGDELRKSNVALLTESQKVKLTALEEAMKLAPVFTAAQSANLLAGIRSGDFSALLGNPFVNLGVAGYTTFSSCTSPSGVFMVNPATKPGQFGSGLTAAPAGSARD